MESPIKIHVPITVSYPALEGVLKKQMIGEYIPRQEEDVNTPPYAKILDVKITGSSAGAHEVVLRIKLNILRTVLKRDEVNLQVQATLGYDNAAQQLFVRKFKLYSITSSGFYNTALEVLANKVAYNQIIAKSRVNLGEVITREVNKANSMLAEGLELKGVKLIGTVKEVYVQDIIPQPDRVSFALALEGSVAASISDLISLMPAS